MMYHLVHDHTAISKQSPNLGCAQHIMESQKVHIILANVGNFTRNILPNIFACAMYFISSTEVFIRVFPTQVKEPKMEIDRR